MESAQQSLLSKGTQQRELSRELKRGSKAEGAQQRVLRRGRSGEGAQRRKMLPRERSTLASNSIIFILVLFCNRGDTRYHSGHPFEGVMPSPY